MNDKINYEVLKPDETLPEPLYLQLAQALKREIRKLNPGECKTLLSERQLSEMLNLNRSTTHLAYVELLNAGLMERCPDKSLAILPDARLKLCGKFPVIGLALPMKFSSYVGSGLRYPMRYIKGLFDRAEERKLSIMTFQLPEPGASQEHISDFINDVCDNLIGIIHLGDRTFDPDKTLSALLNYRGVPQIFISGTTDLAHIGSVFGDPLIGGHQLCRELVKREFSMVGIIRRKPRNDEGNPYFHYVSLQRSTIFKQLLDEYGLICRPEWQLDNFDDSDSARRQLAALVKAGNLPQVFWCVSDTAAWLAIDILSELGVSIPDDISIVGYDGSSEKEAKPVYLTSIEQPFYDLAVTSVDMVLDYFMNGITPENRIKVLPTKLVVNSTLGYPGKVHEKKENEQTAGR